MKKLIVFLALALLANYAHSIRVYKSPLSENAFLISLSAEEVSSVKNNSSYASEYGGEVARELLQLSGAGSSITSKVAELPIFITLAAKYTNDIKKYCNSSPKNNSLTLKYHGVNFKALENIWIASDFADLTIPGTPAYGHAYTIVNELLNAISQ